MGFHLSEEFTQVDYLTPWLSFLNMNVRAHLFNQQTGCAWAGVTWEALGSQGKTAPRPQAALILQRLKHTAPRPTPPGSPGACWQALLRARTLRLGRTQRRQAGQGGGAAAKSYHPALRSQMLRDFCAFKITL